MKLVSGFVTWFLYMREPLLGSATDRELCRTLVTVGLTVVCVSGSVFDSPAHERELTFERRVSFGL